MFVGDPNNDLLGFGGTAQLLARDVTGTQFSIPFRTYFTYIPVLHTFRFPHRYHLWLSA